MVGGGRETSVADPVNDKPLAVSVYHDQKPICPSCDNPFRRIWVQDGITYAYCEARRRVGGKHVICGQHAIIAAEDGFAAVSPLTPGDFRAIQAHSIRLVEMRRAMAKAKRTRDE